MSSSLVIADFPTSFRCLLVLFILVPDLYKSGESHDFAALSSRTELENPKILVDRAFRRQCALLEAEAL